MAKKKVVEIQCDRCPRKEYIDPDAPKSSVTPITITIGDKTLKYEDLCTACSKAVQAHVDGITKKLDGRSPERTAKQTPAPKEEPAIAAPINFQADEPPPPAVLPIVNRPQTVARTAESVRKS